MRIALLLAAALLALAATPALAQDDENVGDDVEVVEPSPTPSDNPCENGGADADYADCAYYCRPRGADDDYGADPDYACAVPVSGHGSPSTGPKPVQQVLPLAASPTLPMTGSGVPVVALFGLAFLLTGAGLRRLIEPD